jgi:hypothetical protein
MYVQCKGFEQLSVSVWVSVFAFAEDAAWKALAVLESGLLVWLNITSGEKGQVSMGMLGVVGRKGFSDALDLGLF